MNAVPTFIGTLIQKTFFVQVVPELAHGLSVTRFGGTHEIGVGDIEHVPCIAECRLHRIAPLLRLHIVSGSRVCDLLTMFVHTGNERDIIAIHTLITRKRISCDRGVGGSQVRSCIYIVDRRSECISAF